MVLGAVVLAIALPILGGVPWYLFLPVAFATWMLMLTLAAAYVKVLFPPKLIRYEDETHPRAFPCKLGTLGTGLVWSAAYVAAYLIARVLYHPWYGALLVAAVIWSFMLMIAGAYQLRPSDPDDLSLFDRRKH